MSYLYTTGDTAKGNAAICELWDSIPEAPVEWTDCNEFTKTYIQCALWSSTDDTDTPMDKNYYPDDIECETLGQIIRDCQRFQEHTCKLMVAYDIGVMTDMQWSVLRIVAPKHPAIRYAGHDFWLTRNHHGAGFWDGDWEESAGEKLTVLAHSFGEYNLTADNGKVYGQ